MSLCKKCKVLMFFSDDGKTEWCINTSCENVYLVFTTWRPLTPMERF